MRFFESEPSASFVSPRNNPLVVEPTVMEFGVGEFL